MTRSGNNAVVLCFLLLALLPTPLDARTPTGLAARRTGWFYPRGAFRQVEDDRWVEKAPAGEFRYKEVARKDQYVELHDFDRHVSLRLYNDYVYAWNARQKRWYHLHNGRWDDPRKQPLDTHRYADVRLQMQGPTERVSFANLGDEFEVLAPASTTYNCISWSLGVRDRWIWPAKNGAPVSFGDFDDLYKGQGYRRSNKLDVDLDSGREKVVLYAKVSVNGVLEPTHSARQLDDGSWSSKVGRLPLIRHLHPEDVSGDTYGEPFALFTRERKVQLPKPSAASNRSRTEVIGSSREEGPTLSPIKSGRSAGSAASRP